MGVNMRRLSLVPALFLFVLSCESASPTDPGFEPAFTHSPDGCAGCATVVSSGAIYTTTPETVGVQTDTKRTLYIHGAGLGEVITGKNYVGTLAAVGSSGAKCKVENNPLGHDVKQYLVQPPDDDGTFGMQYDRLNETSTEHFLNVTWVTLVNGEQTRIRVLLKGNIKGYPPLTVSADPSPPSNPGATTYTFTGGAVKVEELSAPRQPTLTCVNQDVVVVDVTR
jgi:hypothetical protein